MNPVLRPTYLTDVRLTVIDLAAIMCPHNDAPVTDRLTEKRMRVSSLTLIAARTGLNE